LAAIVGFRADSIKNQIFRTGGFIRQNESGDCWSNDKLEAMGAGRHLIRFLQTIIEELIEASD
jgi:hypothetical protein